MEIEFMFLESSIKLCLFFAARISFDFIINTFPIFYMCIESFSKLSWLI